MKVIRRYWVLFILIAVAVGSALIYLIGIHQSIWFDEAYSLILARQPVQELIRLTSIDVHPPLYYLVLKGWIAVFGESAIALRGLGALIGGIAIFVTGLFVKKFFGVRAMVLALIFVALSPMLLRYGFELRMYSLAMLIGLIATWVLFLAHNAKGRRSAIILWLLYGMVVAVGMYTAYYLAFLWVAHLAWLMYDGFRHKTLQRPTWLLGYGIAALLFLPWLPIFITQLTNGALAGIAQPLTADNLLGILSLGFLYQLVWQVGPASGIILAGLLLVITWLGVVAYKKSLGVERRRLTLLAAYIVVPILLITIVSLFRPFYVERYLVPVLVGGYILLGVMAAAASRYHPRFTAASVIFLTILLGVGIFNLTSVGNYNFQRMQRPDVQTVVDDIGTCSKSAAILAKDPYVAIELFGVQPECAVYFMTEYDELRGGYAPLNGSEQEIETPDELQSYDIIHYAYYDTPGHVPPSGYELTAKTDGTLTVETWQKITSE